METETYYMMTGQSTLYFQVADGVVSRAGQASRVPYDKFIEFLHVAELLGMHTGKL